MQFQKSNGKVSNCARPRQGGPPAQHDVFTTLKIRAIMPRTIMCFTVLLILGVRSADLKTS